MRIPGHHII